MKIGEVKVVRKFFSRKNRVYLIKSNDNGLLVLKKFSSKRRAKTEWSFLNAVYGKFAVPRPIEIIEEVYLIMDYVPGTTLLKEPENLGLLASWLSRIHGYGISKGDCTLLNFLVFNRKIYGIDWEEANTYAYPEKDLAEVCGNIMMTGENSLEMCRSFLKKYVIASKNSNFDINFELISFLQSRIRFRPEIKEIIENLIDIVKVNQQVFNLTD